VGALVASVLVFGLTAGAQAQTQSSKSAVQCGKISVLELGATAKATPWQTIMQSTLKTSQQKDLTIGVSLECGLYTKTLVRSKNGEADSSAATAGIEIQVLVDGKPAQPGEVVFARRSQTLTATFQGLFDSCLTVDTNTWSVIIDETCVRPEELELILDTMNANHFNFILDDVGVGVHTIQVQSRINLGSTAQAGSAVATATIGKGSLVVEEIRLVKDSEISM